MYEQIREGGDNKTYTERRKKKVQLIKKLLDSGLEPKWHSPNNWFTLGKYTFNGFTREQVESIKDGTCDLLYK